MFQIEVPPPPPAANGNSSDVKVEIPLDISKYGPLLERAPVLTREAIEQVFETAAQRVELAGDAVMQVAIERVAEAKETARTLRELGKVQAASIERAAVLARDMASLFKSEQEKVTAFRAGATS